MLLVFIIAFILFVIFTHFDDDSDFRIPLIFICILIGIIITFLLSSILFCCNVGQYETVYIYNYEELVVCQDECCVTYYQINEDGSYSIENYELDLSDCVFIEDGTQVIKRQRWHYFKGIDWTFLFPLFDRYIVYK